MPALSEGIVGPFYEFHRAELTGNLGPDEGVAARSVKQ